MTEKVDAQAFLAEYYKVDEKIWDLKHEKSKKDALIAVWLVKNVPGYFRLERIFRGHKQTDMPNLGAKDLLDGFCYWATSCGDEMSSEVLSNTFCQLSFLFNTRRTKANRFFIWKQFMSCPDEHKDTMNNVRDLISCFDPKKRRYDESEKEDYKRYLVNEVYCGSDLCPNKDEGNDFDYSNCFIDDDFNPSFKNQESVK